MLWSENLHIQLFCEKDNDIKKYSVKLPDESILTVIILLSLFSILEYKNSWTFNHLSLPNLK